MLSDLFDHFLVAVISCSNSDPTSIARLKINKNLSIKVSNAQLDELFRKHI